MDRGSADSRSPDGGLVRQHAPCLAFKEFSAHYDEHCSAVIVSQDIEAVLLLSLSAVGGRSGAPPGPISLIIPIHRRRCLSLHLSYFRRSFCSSSCLSKALC